LAESAESTAAAPAEGSQTQSQSTADNGTKTEVVTVKAESSDALILGIALLVLGVAAFVYLNKRMARDSASEFWEAEEDFHGKRLFNDAWNDMKDRGFN
jgi:hypothetical protein